MWWILSVTLASHWWKPMATVCSSTTWPLPETHTHRLGQEAQYTLLLCLCPLSGLCNDSKQAGRQHLEPSTHWHQWLSSGQLSSDWRPALPLYPPQRDRPLRGLGTEAGHSGMPGCKINKDKGQRQIQALQNHPAESIKSCVWVSIIMKLSTSERFVQAKSLSFMERVVWFGLLQTFLGKTNASTVGVQLRTCGASQRERCRKK